MAVCDHQDHVDARIREYILQHGEEPELMRVTAEEYAELYINCFIDFVPNLNKPGDPARRSYKGIELQVLTDQPVAA